MDNDEKTMGTFLDGVVASEIRDTQGEVLDVKGADISDLIAGKGYWNSDHRNNFTDIVGRVTFAKKIHNIDDCDNDRQRYFYNKLKTSIIYASGYLFDQDGEHENAKAVAAILRNQARTDSPLKLKASVEGGVIERGKDTRHLKRTKISRVALTFVPANQNTLIETPQLQKNAVAGDMELVKSLVPFAKMDAPSFIEVAGALSSIESLRNRIEQINGMAKALTAGFGGGSPTDSIGGQVLQTESMENVGKNIDCPSCGKKQLYASYQVRCRECNKSFPFHTLAKLFVSKGK
jgi:hypothetical protein